MIDDCVCPAPHYNVIAHAGCRCQCTSPASVCAVVSWLSATTVSCVCVLLLHQLEFTAAANEIVVAFGRPWAKHEHTIPGFSQFPVAVSLAVGFAQPPLHAFFAVFPAWTRRRAHAHSTALVCSA